MIGSAGRHRVTLAGAEGIERQHKKTKMHQPQAARLHHRVAPRPRPVTMNDQDGRRLAANGLRHIGAGRDPDIRPALEEQLLDAIAVPLEHADHLGLGRARLIRK